MHVNGKSIFIDISAVNTSKQYMEKVTSHSKVMIYRLWKVVNYFSDAKENSPE